MIDSGSLLLSDWFSLHSALWLVQSALCSLIVSVFTLFSDWFRLHSDWFSKNLALSDWLGITLLSDWFSPYSALWLVQSTLWYSALWLVQSSLCSLIGSVYTLLSDWFSLHSALWLVQSILCSLSDWFSLHSALWLVQATLWLATTSSSTNVPEDWKNTTLILR